MQKLVSALSLALIAFSFTPALAASGTAVGVNPSANAENRGNVRELVVGADVEVGEKIVTGSSGQVELIFSDATRLVVGPGSALVIEDYLLRNDTSASKVTVNALAGTFRFVTGKSPKDAYSIKTPTGTIGVRGTAFDFTVASGTTSVLLFHGATQMCAKSGQCTVLKKKCDLGIYDQAASQVIGKDQKYKSFWREHFPLAQNQNSMRREFRIAGARDCLAQPDSGGGSLIDPIIREEPEIPNNPDFAGPFTHNLLP